LGANWVSCPFEIISGLLEMLILDWFKRENLVSREKYHAFGYYKDVAQLC
jgi:hypothetical protein